MIKIKKYLKESKSIRDFVENWIELHGNDMDDRYVGLRFDHKKVKEGEKLEYSKDLTQSDDLRGLYPIFGTKEYKELPWAEGTSMYLIWTEWGYKPIDWSIFGRWGEKGEIGSHLSIVSGKNPVEGFDMYEVLVEDATVEKVLW